MLRTFTCIMCPQGCEITAEGNEAPYTITGNKCKRGHEYVEQELVNPMRNAGQRPLKRADPEG